MEYVLGDQGFSIQLEYDELHISGDSKTGFRPYQLLVSSIAGCSGLVLKKILDKQRINVDDIRIRADVTRAEGGANEVRKIHLVYHIKGKELNAAKIEKALALSRKYCPMIQSVAGSIEVTESFELGR